MAIRRVIAVALLAFAAAACGGQRSGPQSAHLPAATSSAKPGAPRAIAPCRHGDGPRVVERFEPRGESAGLRASIQAFDEDPSKVIIQITNVSTDAICMQREPSFGLKIGAEFAFLYPELHSPWGTRIPNLCEADGRPETYQVLAPQATVTLPPTPFLDCFVLEACGSFRLTLVYSDVGTDPQCTHEVARLRRAELEFLVVID